MGSERSGRSGFTEEIAFPEARKVELLGRYELLAPLGKGGMASVFLARLRGPSGFEKLLALKRIHPTLSEDPRFVDMFLDEARIAAALQHPNIAQVFELGSADSVYFLAMEYLHGEHLGDVLGRAAKSGTPLPVELACWIVARTAEALHHAHESTDAFGKPLSVIHRDVSPQNIFVTYAGNVKLTDFGVAKASSNIVETDTGTVKGKFAYMAPEQALGHEIDRRVDVFALGTVLWEALASRRLFRANTDAQTLLRITRGEVPSLLEARPEVGEDLDAIVRCALALEPNERFETAGALARALQRQCGDVSAEDLRNWMHAHFRAEEERKRAFVTGVAEVEAPSLVEGAAMPEASTSGLVTRGARPQGLGSSPDDALTEATPPRDPALDPPVDVPTPRARVQTLADAQVEVTHAHPQPEAPEPEARPAAAPRSRYSAWVALALLGVVLAGGIGWVLMDDRGPAPPANAAADVVAADDRGARVDIPPPTGDQGAAGALDDGADDAPTEVIARGVDPPLDAIEPPLEVEHVEEIAEPVVRVAPPRVRDVPAPPAAPGTLQVSIASDYQGARYGWARVGGERRTLPAVIRGVPAGPVWIDYQIGETSARRTRVRVAAGGSTTVQLPR